MDATNNSYEDIGVNAFILKQIMSLSDETLLSFSTKHFVSSPEKPIITIQQLLIELQRRANEFRNKYYLEIQQHNNNIALINLTNEFYRDVLVPEFKLSQSNLINLVQISN